MPSWMRAVRALSERRRGAVARAIVSGSIASLASTLALGRRGRRDTGDSLTPLNGPSQWVLGTHAPYQNGFRLPHTVLGFGIHHAMSVFWALPFELLSGGRRPPRPWTDCVVPATLTAAAACFVDYRLTPERFTPGFERRLSRPSLALVYGTFALGLALGRVLLEARAVDTRARRRRESRGTRLAPSPLPASGRIRRSGSETFIQGENQ